MSIPILQAYQEFMCEYVGIKSISTDDIFKDEMERTVTFLSNTFEEMWLSVQTVTGYGNPMVVAS